MFFFDEDYVVYYIKPCLEDALQTLGIEFSWIPAERTWGHICKPSMR